MTTGDRWRQFFQTMVRPDIRLTLVLTFMAIFVFAGLEATFALWTERTLGWGVEQNGYVFAYSGIISAIIQGSLIGPMSRRMGEPTMIRHGFIALGIGLLIIPFSDNLPLLLIAMAVTTYGFSICSPALTSQLSLQVSAADQGAIMGAGRSASTLARVFGPACAGFLFAWLGKDWPFFAGAILMVVVLILAYRLVRKSVPE